MERSVMRSVAWHARIASYELREQTEQGTIATPVNDESRTWHGWLERVPSFAFRSRDGQHFTAVRERKGRGGVYWTAYRSIGGLLKKKYLGAPTRVTLAQLEQVALVLTASKSAISSDHPPSQKGLSTRVERDQNKMPWQASLVATKFFVPTSSHELISRPRLTRLLDEGIGRPLTLVSAPAGSGKTTLLSAWMQAHQPGHPRVAWVSLDEGDNNLVRFWTYALTALDHVQPGLCTELVSYLHARQSPPIQSVLTALINRLAERTEQVLLVLDDYHLVTEQAIHRSLTYLLDHLPSQLRVILSTRSDPPLPLSWLRARGQVLEMRADQLCCTQEETRAFLHEVMGLTLADQELAGVEDRTEGWFAGLQLLALSLQRHTDPGNLLDEVSGSQRYILDYLTDEVLQRQDESVQTFLLYTSIVERLTAPLCDALMERSGSQQMLELLDQTNVFIVPLDMQRCWYRYHVLFGEALRYRLEQTQGELVPALHHRACAWYAEHGQTTEAIAHAIAAREWPWAADLIEQVSALTWGSGEHAMVRRWLEQLPVEVVRARPRLCLAYARTLFMVAPYTTIERWLHDAETAVWATVSAATDGAKDLIPTGNALRASAAHSSGRISSAEPGARPPSGQQEQDNLLGEIAAYRAIITGDYLGEGHVTLGFCQQALAHLSAQDLLARAQVAYARALASHAFGDIVAAIQSAREATALAQAAGNTSSGILYLCRTAYSLLVHGKLHEAVQVAQRAALLGTTPVGLPHAMLCWAYIFQADVLREWNRLDEALELALQAVRLSEQTETVMGLDVGYTVLMSVYLARGELEAAGSAFQQAEEALAQTYSPYRCDAYLIVDWVRFWMASGAVEHATLWAQELAQQGSVSSPLARERQDVARARMLLAQKRPTEALSLLEPLQVGAKKQERFSHVIEMYVLQALAHHLRGEEQEALTILAQAVRLAEPEYYIRHFVDEGPQVAVLLTRLREQQRRRGPTPYLDAVLAAFRQDSTAHARAGQRTMAQPLLNPLSERERDVLQLLARGDSNPEIAEVLVLSVDTVKRHVYNIFSKLGVKNRVQAVTRARALSLLSE